MGATWGLNKAFAGVEANVYANAASKSLTKFGETSKTYGAISNMAQQALKTSGRSFAFNMFKVTCAVITETLEELYVDPMIEAYVTNKVADMGGSEISQILWSGLAESGREQFLSSVTSFMRAGFGGRTQVDANVQLNGIETQIQDNMENTLATQEAKAQQQLTYEYLKEGLSTILMFAGAMAGGIGGSFGTAIGNVMIVAGTSVEGIDSIKDIFEAVLKKDQLDISVETITLSDEQKAPFAEYKFRIPWLPLQTGLRVIKVGPAQKIADLIEEHFPSMVPQGNLFFYKGQVLDELRSLLDYRVSPDNPIYVVHPMAAAGIARNIDSQRIYEKFDRIIRKYLSTLRDFSGEVLKKYTDFVDYTVRRLVPFSPNAVGIMMRLSIRAGQAFASERTSFEQKSILTNRGGHLVSTLCKAYECNIPELQSKFDRSFHDEFNKLLTLDKPVSFRFLKHIYHKAGKDISDNEALSSIFKAINVYHPLFTIFFLATRGTNTLDRLNYLETTEEYFEQHFKILNEDYMKLDKGDKKGITAWNDYIKEPNANFDYVTDIQIDLLLELWDGRDALTGEELVDEDGNLKETVIRHHYRILFIDANHIEFIKFDCRLQALVPLSKKSHGKMRKVIKAEFYEANFEKAMEKWMNGEWYIPQWWSIKYKKAFAGHLRRMGFVEK